MKNLNRYLSIFALVVVSGTPLLNKPVTATEAALTAPASWDYAYKYDSIYGSFLAFDNATTPQSVSYTRTADGAYYNYSFTGNVGGYLPFDITMTFNRSNITWQDMGSGFYEPDDTKIGSDNTVGTVSSKWSISFSNFTNRGYRLYLDTSSNVAMFIQYVVSGIFTEDDAYYVSNFNYANLLIAPGYTITLRTASTNGTRYFDAWYLQDLGVNSTYTDGFDDGFDDGYDDGYNNSASPLWDGLEVVVGVTVNFILFIMTLSIFDISLLNIGIVLVSILGIVWVLKALRG